ncbi:hypothetical protein DC31_15105 [Microbacterium sp. CH12i]|uniref:GNAT family N-acetyltransferase n=1 Tax=Microbacterium sp. CH12i TaxID=1479651 RepID=UPI000460B869|nr:GNAT family N-acetyltransferase [Microbacterium sp. CH12i]KDA05881.1 hypothetical protein DC31_15105 [Microbacterium sp. CH12i]
MTAAEDAPVPVVDPTIDPALLRRVHAEVLEPNFPATELTALDEFVSAALDGKLDVLVAHAGHTPHGAISGAIVGERFGPALLIAWLAVTPQQRSCGIGSALLAAGSARWISLPGVELVLAEIERPDVHRTHEQFGDPQRRLEFYTRAGAGALVVPYYQPPIGAGMPRVRGLLLTVIAAAAPTPIPRTLTVGETAVVRDLIEATMGSAAMADEETAAVFAAIEDPAGLRLIPLADYGDIPYEAVSPHS